MTAFPVFEAILLPYPRREDAIVVAEFGLPTGSFKDRGAAAVVADAAFLGARTVSLDSSGNAGIAVAAAAARAGLSAVVRVAESVSPAKEAVILALGATIEKFATREEAARACAGDRGAYDASHVRNPVFRTGVATLARAWRRAGSIPPTVFLPVGNGSLLLGLWAGISGLRAEGSVDAAPRLIAVQSERCAPIAAPDDPGDGNTIADGCAILAPPAAREIREAIAASGGRAITVTEAEIDRAWRKAWSLGFPIEPTSALAFAGFERIPAAGRCAIIATGSGLKFPPPRPRPMDKMDA